jgi:hypothetical protein
MEKQIKVNTGRQLSDIIQGIVRESIKATLHNNAVAEKERQKAAIEEEDDAASSSGEESSSASKTVEDEKEKMKKGDVTADDVVDRLNAIRSGKSFKDEAIASRLSEYVDSLSKAERTALLAFLKGISQIVTGEIAAQDAIDPGSKPANVEMKKSGETKTKTLKPVVVKAPEKEKEKKKSAEDTSGPVPITPKK